MSQRVLFNGAVLVRPGAATKIDASQFESVVLSGLGIVGLIGEAVGGEPRTLQVFSSAEAVKAFYGSGDIVEAAYMAAAPSNDPRISAGASAFVCYKVNNSTQSTLTKTPHVFTSVQYGVAANSITTALAVGDSANERVLTVTSLDEFGATITETSPSLGAVGKFTIQYVGAGSACTMTISATQLTTTVTAGPGGESLTLNFTDFPTLSALVKYIDALAAYTCAALVTNAPSFDTTYLDAVVAVDIRTTLTTAYARNYDLWDWINNNSSIITDTLTIGSAGPIAAYTATALTGGTRGTSADSNWVTGFTALAGIRINQVVPLASTAATTAQGTFTIAGIVTALASHCRSASSTLGRSERQGWAGVNMTKTNFIAQANTQNTEHLCLFAQKPKRQRTSDGTVMFFEEWAMAALAAGMRAGAPLGEPLTWKYLAIQGVSSDASWSEGTDSDCTDLALNGCCYVNYIPGKGYRFDKVITTYTKSNNDAYTEETIVQIWKAFAYDLRTALQDRFVGRPGNTNMVRMVPATVVNVGELYRNAGAITDSTENGNAVRAYRSISAGLSGDVLSVGVTITPTPGINFVLNTIVLVPAVISA